MAKCGYSDSSDLTQFNQSKTMVVTDVGMLDSSGFAFVAGIKRPRDEFTVPAKNCVWGEAGREFPQTFASDGVSFYCEQATLVTVEQQSLPSGLFAQCFDLSVLKLDVLLLTLVDHAAKYGEQDVAGREQERHIRCEHYQFPMPRAEIKRLGCETRVSRKSRMSRRFEFGGVF